MGEWHLGIVGDVLASKLFLCAPREHRRGNIKSLCKTTNNKTTFTTTTTH